MVNKGNVMQGTPLPYATTTQMAMTKESRVGKGNDYHAWFAMHTQHCACNNDGVAHFVVKGMPKHEAW
jgi:hypothetical protein